MNFLCSWIIEKKYGIGKRLFSISITVYWCKFHQAYWVPEVIYSAWRMSKHIKRGQILISDRFELFLWDEIIWDADSSAFPAMISDGPHALVHHEGNQPVLWHCWVQFQSRYEMLTLSSCCQGKLVLLLHHELRSEGLVTLTTSSSSWRRVGLTFEKQNLPLGCSNL